VGRDGEELVVRQLVNCLNSRWFVFRNVVLPGHSGDLDIVLVGPGGTWVLEVKAYSGDFRVENGRWSKLTSNGHWARVKFGPGAQVVENAKRLCNFFKDNGIMTGNAVKRAIVIAKDTPIDVVSAGTAVWHVEELGHKLAAIRSRTYNTEEQVARLTNALFRTVPGYPIYIRSSGGSA
jgi:hypothetical protein